jgi:hypothetical protein
MKSFKALLAIICMFLLGNATGQEKFLLQYKYEKGKTYKYQDETKFESLQEINGQEMKATGTTLSKMKMTVEDVSVAGDFTLINSLEDLKVTTKMAMMDTTMVKKEFLDKKVQTIISGSGKMIEQKQIDTVKSTKNLMGRGNNLLNLYKEFVVFPDNSLKIGDSWTNDRTDTTEGTQMFTTTNIKYTLSGVEEKNGHQCLKFSLTGKVETGGKMTQMGMEFFMEGSGEINGIVWIDKESCIIISKESNTDQEMTMAMTGQMQMTIPIYTTTNSKFTLVE